MKIIVIGAGIAGLRAARLLHDACNEVIVLEARDRLGGRLWTNRSFADIPVEFGAEFIHGDEVSTYKAIQKLGLRAAYWKKTDDSMFRFADGRFLTMEQARQIDADLDSVRSWDLPEGILSERESFSSYLQKAGFNNIQLQYVRRMFANALGGDPDKVDAGQAFYEIGNKSSVDYRLLDGYDNLVNEQAKNLNICLNKVVQEIYWEEDIKIICEDGSEFISEKCVITIPLGVIKSGKIRFIPELPASKVQALSGLEMGMASKIVFKFDKDVMPDTGAIYSAGCPPMWWAPSYGRDFDGQKIWSAFFSGKWAEELYALTDKQALQKALSVLKYETGISDLKPVDALFIRWAEDPYSLGGYSFCKPGGFKCRQMLGEQTGKMHWAGEATAQSATVHGAWDSAERAFKEIIPD